MKKQRKHYAPEEKVAILRRHLLEKEPISKLCDELGLQPCSPAVSKRSTRSATGSWRRRGSNGRFAASKRLRVLVFSHAR